MLKNINKNQVHGGLVPHLKRKIKNEFLKGKPSRKGVHKRVAEHYIRILDTYAELDHTSALNHVFNDIRQRHGVLGDSKVLRSVLAEELCHFVGVQLKSLYEEIKKMVNNDAHISLEEAKIVAALDLIESQHHLEKQSAQKPFDRVKKSCEDSRE